MSDVKLPFYTLLHVAPSEFTYNGGETRPSFHLEGDKLVKDGEINFVEQIQSYKGLYDVKTILNRFKLGDLTALGSPGGAYIDNTGVDTDLRAYTQVSLENKLAKAYQCLPDDIRSNFDNFEDFSKSISDGSFADKLTKSVGNTGESSNNNVSSAQGGNS